MAAIGTARWDYPQHNLSTEVPRSYHRQGPFLRTACRRSGLQSLYPMSSTRLTDLQKVGLEERPTPQGLSGPSSQCSQLRCPSLATLAGPNPTGPTGTLPKQSSPNHHRTAQNHTPTTHRPHTIAESLRKSPRHLRRPPVSPLQRGAADDRTLATEVTKARCNKTKHIWKSSPPLKVITTDPERVLAHARITLG